MLFCCQGSEARPSFSLMAVPGLASVLPEHLAAHLDLGAGTVGAHPGTERFLSDLRGVFHDEVAYGEALARGNPLVYRVVGVAPAEGDGQLHYGLGTLQAGKIGQEYFLTKGHLHAWRPAAEVYVGLRGDGRMILEEEATGRTRLVPLGAGDVVYVPGHTAHRTANVGSEPLVYLGIYPAAAGHDYAAIAERNFRCCLVEREGQPVLVERARLVRGAGGRP